MSNSEILKRLSLNEKIAKKNPYVIAELSMSSEEIDEEVIDLYEPLLEEIDFDRVLRCADFASINTNEISDVNREDYFDRWKDAHFWKNLLLGSAFSPREIIRREIKDVVSRQLKSAFKLSKVRIVNLKSSKLFYSKDSELCMLERFDERSFISFCMYIFARHLKLSEDDAIKTALRDRVKPPSENSIIQFLDCYLKDGDLYSGVSEESPQWIVERRVLQAVKTGRTTVKSKSVDMLIDHLTNNDKQTKERFLDVLSTMYLNSPNLKSKFGGAIRIFGSSGANGKSKLIDLLIRSVGYECSASVSVQDLDNDRSAYTAATSMLLVDDDAPSDRIKGLASSNFKKLVTGGPMKVRPLYKEEITVTPKCLMVIASNHLPRAEDKSEGFLRRWNFIEINVKLLDRYDLDDDWFNELASDESAQYLCEMLLIRAMTLKTKDSLSEKSSSMKELDVRYANDNNSAVTFANEVGLDKIIGFSVKEVRSMYESYCTENDLPILQRQFNETLENQFDLIVKAVGITRVSEDSDQYAQLHHKMKSTIRAWQHSNDKINASYLKKS